jgi:hypothetical protein
MDHNKNSEEIIDKDMEKFLGELLTVQELQTLKKIIKNKGRLQDTEKVD